MDNSFQSKIKAIRRRIDNLQDKINVLERNNDMCENLSPVEHRVLNMIQHKLISTGDEIENMIDLYIYIKLNSL